MGLLAATTLRLFWEYFRLAYVRWWTAAYLGLVGAYDLLDRALPPGVANLPNLTAEALWWLTLPLLFLAPFPVFAQMRRRLDSVEAEMHQQRAINLQVALEHELDLAFGPSSRLAPATRMEMATARLEALEREIHSGNFSRAGEVIALKKIILPLFLDYYATAGHYYWEICERLSAMLRLMKERSLCSDSDLLEPLPRNVNPLTGRPMKPPPVPKPPLP